MQARRGELIDVLDGCDGLVAEVGGEPFGLVLWAIEPDQGSAEVRALVVDAAIRNRGVGRLLLEGAVAVLEASDVGRAWLVTTNDNLAALALYQKAGWSLAALRRGGVEESRRTVKPQIPELGEHGIPLRDELELSLDLTRHTA